MTVNVAPPHPATGSALWAGPIRHGDAEVARARAAWPACAAQPLSYRIETLRRFANVVRGKNDKLADLIARETGKPIWEALTEVDSVINKVEISVAAYAERTGQKRLEGSMGTRTAVQHKPHGVMARSEEHTSELQSLMRISYAVFCLKKKKKKKR